MNLIIGIDNGVTGGLVALSSHFGPPVSKLVMPVQKTKKGNEINIIIVKEWIQELQHPWDDILVAIEEPGGSKSAKAAASMAASFGSLRGAFAWQGITLVRVTPQSWQKAMLGKCSDTKAAALTKARELWPQESWLATDRSKVPHDGLVDAALIGEFSRRTLNLQKP